MSFLKKVWVSNNTNNQQQKSNNQNNPGVAQSMFDLDQKTPVPAPKSYDLQSIKPNKPPASAKSSKTGLFSNMKIKKANTDDKKDLVESASTVQTRDTTIESKLQQSAYQPPQIPKIQYKAEEIPMVEVVQPYQPSSNLFSKKRSQKSLNKHTQQDVAPIYNPPSVPLPGKRRNSSISKAQSQQSNTSASAKQSTNSFAPIKSATSGSYLAKSSSKSSLESKNKQSKSIRKESEKIDEVKQIQNDMLRAKERIVQKMRHQKEIKNQIMNESESLSLLRDRQNQAVQKQNAAVESEEYDRAAELQQQLTQLKEQIDTVQLQLDRLQKSFVQAQSAICNEYIRQEQQKSVINKRLARAKSEAERAYDNVMKIETEKIQLQKGKMQRDRKKLGSLENEIKFNEEKIQQLEHQYQQDLNNQTRVLKEHKDQLSSRRFQITDQIRDLERRLEQKREELSQTQNELNMADSNIQEIKRGFENQYRKIVQRKDKLYEMEMERDQFKASLSQLEVLTEQQVKNLDVALITMRENVNFISQQCNEHQERNITFKQRLQNRQRAFDQFLQETKVLKQYQRTLKVKHDRLKEIEFKKSSLALEVSLLDGKKRELKEKIPQLETEKMVLVTAKNFKGAQLKSTEIKQANDKLVSLNSQMEDCYEQEKKFDKLYTDAQELLNAEKDTQNTLNKNLAKSQYELQSIRLQDLTQQKMALSKYPSSEKNQILSFVESQIEILSDQLQFLVSEYGLQKIKQGNQGQSIQHDTELPQKQPQRNEQEQSSVKDQYQNLQQQQEPIETEDSGQQPKSTSQQKVEDAEEAHEGFENNQKGGQESAEQVDTEGYQPPSF